MTSLKRFIAGLLCLLLSPLPALSEPQASGQHAGQINALIPAATRNAQTANVKDELLWNDLLKTEHSGRVRAGLTDGSILSLGSDSELRVVEHDSASQQTSLEMNFGKVRSRVVKITKQGGKFEMKTPNAVIGVIGTEFYAGYEPNKTTVICYKGQVSVTPLGNARVLKNSEQPGSAGNSILVGAGQMVVITSEIPPAGFQPTDTPADVQQVSMLATDVDVPDNTPPGRHGHTGHGVRNALLGSGVVVGLTLGLVLGARGTPPCQINPQTAKCP